MVIQQEKVRLAEPDLFGFVNLLQDSSESVLNLMAEQISKLDDSSLKGIEELVQKADDDDLIDNWYHASKLSLLNQIQNWKKSGDLEEGLFLISRLKNPGLDVAKYKTILDNYAARVAQKLTASSTGQEAINALNQVLYKEESYIGNQANYYDMDNNFLHTVIDTGTGNPIMISVIYILVARRLGLDIKGIGTPGHFIVKFEDQLLDPFFAGRDITKEECVLRSQELRVYWRDEYLEPIDDTFIISRCIRNLIAIYKKLNEFEKAADATSLLKLV